MKRLVVVPFLLFFSLVLSGCTSFFDKNNKAGLQVLTNDVTASIFLDGQYVEKTPYINKELKPGQYALRIEPEDSSLVPYDTTVNLGRGLLTVVTWKPGTQMELSGGVVYELEKLSSTKQTELSIITIPDGAVVSIDEGEKEFSPLLKTDIKPGTHEIAISLPSYESQSHTINVVEGHRLNVLISLAKNPTDDQISTSQATTTPTASNSADTRQQTTAASTSAQKSDLDSVELSANPPTGPTIMITSTNFFQDGKEVLRVRDGMGAGAKELGFAPVGSRYAYLNETSGGWYKINFQGTEGWVSGTYAKLEN